MVAGCEVELEVEAPVLAGVTAPLSLLAVLLLLFFFSFLPLGVNSSFSAVAFELPLAFAELLLAAGIVFPDGVVPVAGGVLEGPVGVFAEAPPLAFAEAAEPLLDAEPELSAAYANVAPPSRSIAAAATRPVFLTVIIFLLLAAFSAGRV